MIIYDGNSLEFGQYVSDVFDFNTEIWWHCDDDEIIEISDFPEGVYTIKSHKKYITNKKNVWNRQNIDGSLYHNKQPFSIHICF